MKRALIIGCAADVWKDVARARELGEYEQTYCVKYAGVHWPGQSFVWCTLHPEFHDRYEAERKALGLGGTYETVAPLPGELGAHGKKGKIDRRVSYRWPPMNASASSGIYGAKVALHDGYDRIVLAGIPMSREGGHFVRRKPWEHWLSFMKGFELALPYLKGKVKSVSGYTAEKLGRPTSEWLYNG